MWSTAIRNIRIPYYTKEQTVELKKPDGYKSSQSSSIRYIPPTNLSLKRPEEEI